MKAAFSKHTLDGKGAAMHPLITGNYSICTPNSSPKSKGRDKKTTIRSISHANHQRRRCTIRNRNTTSPAIS
jgi:hypothetical protein